MGKYVIGGFIASNSGKIEECISFVKISGGKEKAGRFVGSNLGSMESSFSSNNANNLANMRTDKWIEKIPKQNNVIEIRTKEELFNFAEKVNSGNQQFANANVKLLNNLDLGGKEWTPIGNSPETPFGGLFNGSNHMVRNYKISSKTTGFKGLFGINKGEIYNLSVDCFMKGSGCCGGIAATNEGGKVGCCSSIVSIQGRKNGAVIGGLIGNNSGQVFKCYTAGRFDFFIFPVIPAIVTAATVIVVGSAGVLGYNMSNRGGKQSIFAPIKVDENQVVIEDDSEQGSEDGNTIEFRINRTIDVSMVTGKCSIDFANPSSSNQYIVVEMVMKNADNESFVVASSDAVEPGYGLQFIQFAGDKLGKMEEGEYEATVNLIPYNVETNERAVVETQLPVVIKTHK